MNWGGAHALIGLTITDNQSYNGDSFFLMATNLQHSKVSGNLVYNACKAITGGQAFGMWMGGTGSTEFLNNTFINTVTAPNGMIKGIAPRDGDIIGFNKFVGMRDGTPIEDAAYKMTCPQIMNTGWYDKQPTYADNTAALAGGLTAGARYKTAAGIQMVVY